MARSPVWGVTCVVLQLHLLSTNAIKHMELDMGEIQQTGYNIDGASVVSRISNNTDLTVPWAVLMPSKPSALLLVQVEMLDIPCACGQRISLQEADFSSGIDHKYLLVKDFCGSLTDLFPVQRFEPSEHYLLTRTQGYGLHIVWSSGSQPQCRQETGPQGFRFIITSFTSIAACDPKTSFVCAWMCISRDLVCDGVDHCLDKSDERQNCTKIPEVLPSLPVPMCLPSPCGETSLQWRFHNNTLTLLIPMVLALIFLSVAILWRNKQLLRRLLRDNNVHQRRSPTVFESSEIATAEHETFYHVDMPEVMGADPTNFDPSWGIQLPPPYSAVDGGSVPPPLAIQGEPPPLYADVVQENPSIPESAELKPYSSDDQIDHSSHTDS